MNVNNALVSELQHEAIATRKCLERIPEDKFDWKPHEKSMSVSRLAAHVAEMIGWVKDTLETPELDFATMDYKPFVPQTTAELVEYFEKNLAEATEALKNASAETMMGNWKMRNGE